MKLLWVLAVCAAAVLADDVIVLTDADWEEGIKQHEVALVKFYAPWYVSTLFPLHAAPHIHPL